jgi:Zn-dependent peptidase ImmA (M78 family)
MAITKLHNKAEYEAYALLEKFKINKPAIDIDKIVKGLGLSLVPYKFEDEVSGVLILDDSTGIISYNIAHKPNRQRFTIAHELGHYILHRKSEKLFIDKDFIVKYRSNKDYDTAEMQQEQQANAFAAAILMPLNLLQAELKKPKFRKLDEITLIDSLSELFKVSPQAMTYRLANIMQFSEKW